MAACAVAVVVLAAPDAHAVPPDPQFTQQTEDYITAKHLEFLAPIVAAGSIPTAEQEGQAWCRAAMWWKMSNPGGEAKLTMAGLIKLRRLEVMCGQRMRRAPVLPSEPQTPPPTMVTLPGGDGVENVEAMTDHDGTHEAVEDFMRWHPDEFEDAPTEQEYIERRLFWWEVIGEGAELRGHIVKPVGVAGPGVDLSGEEHAYNASEAAEAERARREWREKHPNAPEPAPSTQTAGGDPPPGYTVNPYRGGLVPLPPPGFMVEPFRGSVVRDPDFGSVDPLDTERWARARQPVSVGSNDEVGSGARRRAQAVGAATNIIGGMLGVGGGGGRGPQLARCRVHDSDFSTFNNGDVDLSAMARRQGDNIVVFADIVHAPGSGTFQAAILQNQHGQVLAPANAEICELWSQWRLSVSWTSTTYRNGRQIDQDHGG